MVGKRAGSGREEVGEWVPPSVGALVLLLL